jgi:ubiquinone/menaquinone biosynthesis C-methylase UbiE
MIPSIFFKTYQQTRSALYFAESLPLGLMAHWITGEGPTAFQDPEKLKGLLQRMNDLWEEDARHFSQGDFPLSLLAGNSPLKHSQSFIDVLIDAFFVARRMKEGHSQDFSAKEQEQADQSPAYFRRNFHFQSGGYFSRASARRYDHQVDILFSGNTDAMRRLGFAPLLPELKDQSFKALEIACGQGGASRQFASLFPKAHLIAGDLSPAYLQEAKERLKNFPQIDCVQMAAEELFFKKDEFDLVFHVYLFHELPAAIRKQVMRESLRVLKPGGRLLITDSLQLGDHPPSDWALREFPVRYHEPFYLNYIKSPLEKLFKEFGLEEIHSQTHFLTKTVIAKKP